MGDEGGNKDGEEITKEERNGDTGIKTFSHRRRHDIPLSSFFPDSVSIYVWAYVIIT